MDHDPMFHYIYTFDNLFLLQHQAPDTAYVHYSIDVLSAFFITYSAYPLGEWISEQIKPYEKSLKN